MSSYTNQSTIDSTIDQFPTPPTLASIEADEKLLDFLLQKVQTDVLDSVDLLGLTDSAYEKLDEMIGVLGTLVEANDIKEQCYAIFRLTLSSPFNNTCALKKYANRRLRKYDTFL